jgi:hypothetical protein
MRNLLILTIGFLLSACGSGDGITGPQTGTAACSVDGQKQFVYDAMRDWYLWNDSLPANLDLSGFANPQAVLDHLVGFRPTSDGSGNPIPVFSFINSAEADAQFFGEGRYEGFGFSYRSVDSGEEDLRLSRVFFDSPANRAGLARGQRILELNGRTIAQINAAEGVSAVLDAPPVDFRMRRPDGTEFNALIDIDIVTIDPVPQWRVIPAGGGRNIGYIELATFISTADPQFDVVFAEFLASNVNDVIIDLRYNGGGLVRTAELLGDFLGGDVAENLIFSKTQFNADRAAANDSTEFFERRGNSVNLSQLVVIASQSTASASELVTNSMRPHVNVGIVGDRTFGKPVGQVGIEFCDQILRPTSFQTVNSLDFGEYFGGLQANCAAADELDIPVGDDTDPNMVAAISWIETGACPVASAPSGVRKAAASIESSRPVLDGRPEREFLDAY